MKVRLLRSGAILFDMIHRTSHGGHLHHFQCYGYEEQVTDDAMYRVVTSAHAFEGATDVIATRHKPGVCMVQVIHSSPKVSTNMVMYCKDELLPKGTEIFHDNGRTD